MRQLILAASLAVCVPFVAHADGVPERISFQPQVKGTRCLRPETLAMIDQLVAKIGLIEITSTCGGRHARRSQHYLGRAIDFRPLKSTPKRAAAVARELEGVGGVGSYSNGLVHVDVGERELSWHGHKRAKRRYAQAR